MTSMHRPTWNGNEEALRKGVRTPVNADREGTPVKVIGKKTEWQGKYLRSVLLTYSQPGETTEAEKVRQWEAVERVGCDCIVGLVPFTEDGAVILIRQFRPPLNCFVVELPAGLCEPGEQPQDAAKRELIEETGYSAGRLHFLAEGPLSSGISSEMLTVYLAEGLSYVGIGSRDETEDIEVLKVPLSHISEELEKMRNVGDCIDLKIYGLIELAREFTSKKRHG
jgi:ADP-ribose pyrophosphatase